MPLKVALVAHHFDLGGTEKSLLNHALAFDPARVSVRAVARAGPARRDGEFADAGIPVDHAYGDPVRLANLLRGADVVHVGRNGGSDSGLPLAAKRAGVGVLVATNVFGEVDDSPEEQLFGAHLLVSQMCAMRHRKVRGEHLDRWHRRHRVLPNPVDVTRLRALAPSREDAKRELGLSPEAVIAGRLGRADDRKWSPIVLASLPHLRRLVPSARFLAVGMTPERRGQARRLRVQDMIVEVDPTADERRLATLYAACDVLASASSIGESFGVGLAEAQALGIPVVTSSTPHTDNAQVEVVDHGVTGYLADHPRVFAEALAELLSNAERREIFGRCGRDRADRLWAAEPLTRRLEDLYDQLVANGSLAAPSWPEDTTQAAFEADYPRLASLRFRPLTRSERFEARTAILLERSKWVAKDVRSDPARTSRLIARRLRWR